MPSGTSCPAMTPWISGDPQDQRHQPRPATDRADLVTIPALPGRRNPGLRLSYRSTCSDGTQAHVLAVIEHATGRTPGPHPYLEPGLSAGLLSDYETHHNQHRPHRFLRGAAPLKALPELADLAHYRVRRHARVAGLIHEYRPAGPMTWTKFSARTGRLGRGGAHGRQFRGHGADVRRVERPQNQGHADRASRDQLRAVPAVTPSRTSQSVPAISSAASRRAARNARPCGNGPPPARQPRRQAIGAARGRAGRTRRLARPAHSQDNGSRAGPPDRHATRTPARPGPGRGRAGWVPDALSRAGYPPIGEHDGCAQDLATGRDGRP